MWKRVAIIKRKKKWHKIHKIFYEILIKDKKLIYYSQNQLLYITRHIIEHNFFIQTSNYNLQYCLYSSQMGNNFCHCFQRNVTQKDPIQPHPPILKPQQPYVPQVHVADDKKQIELKQFKQQKILGKNAYGTVVQVKRKVGNEQKLYAMKRIDKLKIKQKNLFQMEYLEKVILSSKNDFLVNIYFTFQTDRAIFIIMEYIEKGDLFFYMKNHSFNQDEIRQIVAEVIQALQFLHSKSIIYRDLKPENILITNEGHIKITDFGLSKLQRQNQPALTFSGSLQYTAPEIFLENKAGYGKAIDLWAVGILLYEIKHKLTPFYSENDSQLRKKIMEVEYRFDESCSQEYKDLIKKLLIKNPVQRLSLHEIKTHPFFKGIDWEQVKNRQNPPLLKKIVDCDNIKYRRLLQDASQRKYINNRENEKKQFFPTLHQFTFESQQLIGGNPSNNF